MTKTKEEMVDEVRGRFIFTGGVCAVATVIFAAGDLPSWTVVLMGGFGLVSYVLATVAHKIEWKDVDDS